MSNGWEGLQTIGSPDTTGYWLDRMTVHNAPAVFAEIWHDPDHLNAFGENIAAHHPRLCDFEAGFVYWQGSRLSYGAFDGQTAIGWMGLTRSGGGALGEVGYWIGGRHIRKGYASQFLSLLTGAVFTQTDIEAVTASIDPDNEASIRTVKRAGFRSRWPAEGGQWPFILERERWQHLFQPNTGEK